MLEESSVLTAYRVATINIVTVQEGIMETTTELQLPESLLIIPQQQQLTKLLNNPQAMLTTRQRLHHQLI